MSVVKLWCAAGSPVPNWTGKAKTARAAPDPRPGVCCLTGDAGPVYPARFVISETFTALDRLPYRDVDPDGLAFGPAAAWAIRCRPLMQLPHAIVAGRLMQCTPSGLYSALHNMAPSGVVLVPQSRQKHLAPWCEAGTVRVDDESLMWGPDERDRLGTYRTLRALGSGEAALAEPSPRYPTLAKLDRTDRRWCLEWWPHLDPWRAHPAYLDVAARATRQDP